MIGKLIELNNSWTTELGVGTSDLEPRQKVTKYAWNWFELCASKAASVYWAGRLTIQPIIDARRTERVLTLRCLATTVNTTNNNEL